MKIPDYIQDAFSRQGIGDLLYAIHTDMTHDGDYSDVYVGVDYKSLYILYGEEKVVHVSGARRIVAEYRMDSLESYSLEELGELKTEKLLSTGRLICTVDSKEKQLLLFTLGHLTFVERLIKVTKNIAEMSKSDADEGTHGGSVSGTSGTPGSKNKDPLKDVLLDDRLFCPKCGTRYPEPDRKLCPKCMDKVSLAIRLLGFFTYYKKQVALIMTVMVATTALSIFSPYVSNRMFMDEVLTIGGRYYGAILAMVGLLLLVRMVNVAGNILFSYILARTVPWIIFDLKMRIFEAMQKLSVGFYTSKRTGALMNRVNRDATNIYWFFVDGVPFLLVNLVMFIGIITLMFIMDVQLALVCVAILPLAIIMFRVL